jgi:hypothetical protein
MGFMDTARLISLHSGGLMYLRRHVKQPILLRLFAGLSCDRTRASSVATKVEESSSILGSTK